MASAAHAFLVTLVALSVWSYQPCEAAAPPGVPVVRVGRTISTLGFYALEATPIINGVRFWYEWLNRTSGFIFRNNDTDYYLELVEYNDASDATLVDVLYRDMEMFDNVVATFGPWSTALTLPAIQRTNKTGLPFLFTAGAPNFYSSGYKHSFGMFVTGVERGIPCFELYKSLGAATAVIIASSDPFQQSLLAPIASRLRGLNITVQFNQTIPIGTTDYLQVATAVRDINPDVVICLLESSLYGPFLRDLRSVQKSNDRPSMVFNSNGGAVSGSYALADFEDFRWALDQAYGATQWSPFLKFVDANFGTTAQFAQEYQARFGYQPDFSDALAVASGFVMLDALQRASSFAKADIVSALQATLIQDSIVGPISFLASGKINSSGLCVQLQPPDKQTITSTSARIMTPVAPENLALSRPLYPISVIRPPGPKYTRGQRIAIIAGCSVVGLVILAALLAGIIYLFNKRYHVLFFSKNSLPKASDQW